MSPSALKKYEENRQSDLKSLSVSKKDSTQLQNLNFERSDMKGFSQTRVVETSERRKS